MKLTKLSFSVMLLCGVAPSFGQTATPGQSDTLQRDSALSEIIVTAQKTAEPLLTVPVPVTAVSADTLLRSNQVTFQSYFQSIPNVNIDIAASGAPFVSIRGMSTGAGIVNPTMSFTIDGIQFGSSSGYGAAFGNIPDIDPTNLARIEVLEGPQGTLYGSDSLSGLINYVTLDPSTTESSGRVEAGLSSVQNADSPGYDVRAAGNFPLSDSVALRASAFVREAPGYIDNVATGKDGANRVDAQGGYLALLIRPSDLWSLKLSALYQNTQAYGFAFADPTLGLGNLKQSNIPGTGLLHNSNQAYSAIFKAQLGKAQLTSLTAFSVNSGYQALDDTWDYGPIAQAVFGVGGAKDLDQSKTNKFSQEVRLSLPVTRWLDWMVGLYYAYEDTHTEQDIWGANPATGQIQPTWNVVLASWPSTLNQEAVFTNFTVHFTDRFDVQLGGRESINRQTYSEVDGGGFSSIFGLSNSPLGFVTPQVDTKDSAFTYLITPRFRFTPDVMVYARVATGFRNGGPNPTCTAFDLPCHFDPDRTHDYEVGLKAAFLEHRLVVDTSIFYMPWKDIQLPYLPACGCASTVINAGNAKSQGIELKVDGRPMPDLTLSGWVNYNDAVMTSVSFAGIGFVYKPGTALPFSSKYSAHLDAQQDFQISSQATLSVGAQASYVGSRASGISDSPTLLHFPGYVQTDLRAGLDLKAWHFMLYAKNVANVRGITGSLLPFQQYNAYIQPRTVGVSVARNF
ncbi:MAG TPA: TonB-dependent receptor [Steroidobacteraceae bacterium]|jgi:outer membrane receptor protein involved in Fe transport|nr:TonB-dependent receptor [Steroidobacteraceae bacterium]